MSRKIIPTIRSLNPFGKGSLKTKSIDIGEGTAVHNMYITSANIDFTIPIKQEIRAAFLRVFAGESISFEALFDRSHQDELRALDNLTDLRFTKNLSEPLLVNDDFIRVISFNRDIEDTSSSIDNIALHVTTPTSDSVFNTDNSVLSIQPEKNDIVNINSNNISFNAEAVLTENIASFDNPYIDFAKPYDIDQTIVSDNSTISINKAIREKPKALDLVGVPDGSTYVFVKSEKDTTHAVDEFSRVVSFNRDIIDQTLANELIAFGYNALKTDNLIVTDINTLDIMPVYKDTISNNDIYSTLVSFDRKPLELVSSLESLFLDASKQLLDVPTAADNFTRDVEYYRSLDDIISIIDVKTFDIQPTLKDNILSVDSLFLDSSKQLLDASIAADNFTRDVEYYRSLNDTVSNNDVKTFDIQPTLKDNILSNDIFQSLVSKYKEDNTIANDAIQDFNVTKGLSDIAFANDINTLDIMPVYKDTVSNNDVYSTLISFDRKPLELVSSLESFNRYVNFNRDLTNPALAIDNSQFDIQPTLKDNILSVDSFNRDVNFNKTIRETPKALDLVGVPDGSTYIFVKSEKDTIHAVDEFSRDVNFNRDLTNAALAIDNSQFDIYKALNLDVPTVADNFTRDVEYYRSLNDSVLSTELHSINFIKSPITDTVLSNDIFRSLVSIYKEDNTIANDAIQDFNITKGLSDIAFANDIFESILTLGRILSNNVIPSDEGLVAIQNYFDDEYVIWDETYNGEVTPF